MATQSSFKKSSKMQFLLVTESRLKDYSEFVPGDLEPIWMKHEIDGGPKPTPVASDCANQVVIRLDEKLSRCSDIFNIPTWVGEDCRNKALF